MIVEDKTYIFDPKPLNKFIRREYLIILTLNDIIGKLAGKSIFQ